MSTPKSIEILTDNLAKLPGIGKKTASRLAFHIVHADKSYAQMLAKSILDVKEKICLCDICMNITESNPCRICSDTSRDKTLVCVVEGPSEVALFERTGKFKGLYHVLHGNLSALDGIGPSAIRLKELKSRVAQGKVQEIIIATSTTVEGEGTALFIKDMFKDDKLRLSRIASGVPLGGDLKFVDEMTLSSSLEGRRKY